MLSIRIRKHFFWLALLLHLLLLLSLSTRWSFLFLFDKPREEDKPSLYIPSYVYHQPPSPIIKEQTPTPKNPTPENKPISKLGIKKPSTTKPVPAQASRQQIQQLDKISKTDQEPIHLIGKNKLVKPLIKLLARALGQRLTYPKIAMDFNLRGTVYVSFVIHPDGRITDVKLAKTSSAEVLDEEGVRAVNAMSPVGYVSDYLKEPEPVIVGIIF